MTWKPGMFCHFSTDKNHPTPKKRKVGKLVEISSTYIQGQDHYQNIVIEDSYGKWEQKDKLKFYNKTLNLTGISGAFFSHIEDNQDKKYFQRDEQFFVSQLKPYLQSTYKDKKNIEIAKSFIQPSKRDLLCFERSLVGHLVILMEIFKKIAYSYPDTWNIPDDHLGGNCDTKQGAYYATSDSFEDIIFQYQLSWTSVRNRQKGHSEHVNEPRIKLSEDRCEELKIASIFLHDSISTWICDFTGDEEKISEFEYLELLKQASDITKRVIEL